jgi:putative endonuclease
MNERGQQAETLALSWLQQRGLVCVARNYRCRMGEIDLIMHDGTTLVFVEVRQRRSARFGGAAASITPAKQARLVRTAEHYLHTLPSLPPCRFDAVLLDGQQPPEWLQNII